MPHIPDMFEFCPRCGSRSQNVGANPFHCQNCEFVYYFNPVIAVAGVVTDSEGKVLLLRRGRDPGKGKLGLPGGFVDLGESTEDALAREVKEETNLDVLRMHYIKSFPNTYTFREVTYVVTDVFYACEVESLEFLKLQASEIDGHEFCHPTTAELSEMAFESNRKAVELYLRGGS